MRRLRVCKRSLRHVLIAVFFGFLAPLTSVGETMTLDLREWDGVTTQLADGWIIDNVLKYSSESLQGAAYFANNTGRIRSPTFPRTIVQVRVESATRSKDLKRELSLVPYVDGKAISSISLTRPTGSVFVEERIDLSSRGSTSFSLVPSGGSGNWAIRKITVVYGEYEPEVLPVDGVLATGTGTDAFTLEWKPVIDAVGYVVDVWTNDEAFVHQDAVVTDCSFCCTAQPVIYGYSVKARFSVHGETIDSAAVTGRVEMANPPWLRCWKLSEFLPKPGYRLADFSCLGEITTRIAWTNGIGGDLFYAFRNDDPAPQIHRATDKSTNGALYCYNAGTEAMPTNGLALLGTDNVAMRLILPIRLDAEQRVVELAVSFVAHEVKMGASDETTMSFAYATVDDIQTMDCDDVFWTDVPAAAFSSTNGTASLRADIPVASLRGARNLCLRWSVPKKAKSSMLGLSDIRVFGKLRRGGMLIVVK